MPGRGSHGNMENEKEGKNNGTHNALQAWLYRCDGDVL